jgi:hypothetical protein
VRMQLKICTEADYLQAHLTVIVGESRRRNAFQNVKQRVTSILKKWIAAANGDLTARLESTVKFRAASLSQRSATTSELAGRQSGSLPQGATGRCDKQS